MTLTKNAGNTGLSPFEHPGPLFAKCAPPSSNLKICIVVPVRNEAALLTETLQALNNQVDTNGNNLNKDIYEVLLLVNNCTDESAEIAAKYQIQHPGFRLHIAEIWLPVAKANIGTVRRMLMDEACRRLKESGHLNGIIASTDGDTVVDAKWAWQIMQEITNGNDAVGGRILTHSSDRPVRLFYLRDVMYRSLMARAEAILYPHPHDPWPRHFQYFGASLAVTSRVYEQAGRLPEVPFLEDSAFYDALNLIDARIRKSNLVKVYTSDRMTGRVEIGFSEQLKKWNGQLEKNKLHIVGSVAAQLEKLACKQLLRECRNGYLNTGFCNEEKLLVLASRLWIPAGWLNFQIKNTLYFGQLWHKTELKLVVKDWYRRWKDIPVTQAIIELRAFVSKH